MPLRDHFHSPTDPVGWDGVHGQWPAMIVLNLFAKLPKGYVASPHVHIGRDYEVDIGALEADLSSFDEYEVRIYDAERGRQLVAAIEFVSPANKNRPEHRRLFAGKCATLLAKRVSVIIVDVVTDRHFNLYGDLLDHIGHTDPALAPEPPGLYAAACRWKEQRRRDRFETWFHPLAVGQPLPTLPLWLDDDLAIPLDLETTYEETCRVLHLA
jgi:hypothetical protein